MGFLIVWYYCTLTIRESILIVNGSRIKGWWRFHHFVSVVAGGILLVWPGGSAYSAYRGQHVAFNIYVTLLQLLQFQYQKGCLYRLRVLAREKTWTSPSMAFTPGCGRDWCGYSLFSTLATSWRSTMHMFSTSSIISFPIQH